MILWSFLILNSAGNVLECSDDGPADTCGLSSELESFSLVKGTQYTIVVDGYGLKEEGTFTIEIARVPFPSQPGALFIESVHQLYNDGLGEVNFLIEF